MGVEGAKGSVTALKGALVLARAVPGCFGSLTDLLKNPAGTNRSGPEPCVEAGVVVEVDAVLDPADALAGNGLTSAQPGNSARVMHRANK